MEMAVKTAHAKPWERKRIQLPVVYAAEHWGVLYITVTSVWRNPITVSVLGISEQIDSMPGNVNLEELGIVGSKGRSGTKEDIQYMTLVMSKCLAGQTYSVIFRAFYAG